MKVVYLSDDFPPESFGGAGISTYELARGVRAAGHEVIVITTCRQAREAGESAYEELRVIRIQSDYPERWRAWRSLYNPPVVRKLDRILRELRPDVVHANNIHYHLSYHALALGRRYAKRVIWTARDAMAVSYGKLATRQYLERLDPRLSWRDHLRQAGKRWDPLRQFFIKRYLSQADARIAVSEALQTLLAANGIGGVDVIHTGIDAHAWQASDESVCAFKEQHDLADKKVILFGGRLASAATALRALYMVSEKVPDAALVVMGRRDERIARAAADLPVIFTGWVEGREKVAAYAASDVVWVPSTYFDAFPRSALEGQAAGKPVIATKFGGARELVKDGETGYVVNPLHPREIAEKTIELLQDPHTAQAFGHAARERVRSEFSLANMVNAYLTSYRTPA